MDDYERLRRRQIDPDDELQIAREAAKRTARRLGRFVPLVGGLLVLIWLASGTYTVNPGEQGVVRHFGREIGKTAPGLNYRLPWPIQQVDVVNVEAIRRIEIGFRTQQGQQVRMPNEALMLTGDENIVDLQLIVQYRVGDPSQFLFRLRNPEETLRDATEVAIRGVVGNMKIDDVLTTQRGEAQELTLRYLQNLMNEYQSGLLITDVKLQVVDPPDQVKDAFNEVVRAREDRERQQNEAQAYREDVLPKARGEAERILRAAEAYAQERVFLARGDVAKFTAVLVEYRKGKDVTRERLYLETIERVLGKTRKLVIDGAIGEKALPFLPISEIGGASPARPSPAEPPRVPPQPTTPSAPTPRPQPTPAVVPSR